MSAVVWATTPVGLMRVPASEAKAWHRFGERRWAEAWATDDGDVAAGCELLDRFEGWDGPAPGDVAAEFDALDRRLVAYDRWCDVQGIDPLRRPRPFGWSV